MIRRILSVAIVAVLFTAASAVGPDSRVPEAQAGGAPSGGMRCGNGIVLFFGPTVVAEQGSRYDNGTVHWKAELWYHDGTQWKYWKEGPWRGAQVMSNTGPSMGTTTGWAGPTWYGTDGGHSEFFFEAPPGWWYAVRHVAYDRGTWSVGWAWSDGTTHPQGQTSCKT